MEIVILIQEVGPYIRICLQEWWGPFADASCRKQIVTSWWFWSAAIVAISDPAIRDRSRFDGVCHIE